MIYRSVETFPPAKLNLFLEVLGRRTDGYHDIDTVMMAVDLRDALRVERTEEGDIQLVCTWMPSERVWQQRLQSRKELLLAGAEVLPQPTIDTLQLPAPEQNLVYRSLSRFKQVFSQEYGFKVRLEKHIPAGAGMGGASSNAASALRCAALLCDVELDDPRLLALAAEIGSDVPFFCGLPDERQASSSRASASSGGRRKACTLSHARAGGRGERLEGFYQPGMNHFVIVYPPHGLSTAEVYRHCSWHAEPRQAAPMLGGLAACYPIQQIIPHLFNRLAEPARRLSHWIDRTLDAIQSVGLSGAAMTGSGSACFAFAPSATVARRAANRLAGFGIGVCFATNSVRLPTPIRFLT